MIFEIKESGSYEAKTLSSFVRRPTWCVSRDAEGDNSEGLAKIVFESEYWPETDNDKHNFREELSAAGTGILTAVVLMLSAIIIMELLGVI